MRKQSGITVLELIISLGITSSMVAFTLEMANAVEEASAELQNENLNIKALREKIQSAKPKSLESLSDELAEIELEEYDAL